jgi:hypothetical protein
MERPSRVSGNWPSEKDDYPYNYIPGQYAYMGTKRREFEKSVKFQNHKSDGAVINLAAHDPIDWPNIISIWKGLIVQKYIQNQHNIGNKVEDMIIVEVVLRHFHRSCYRSSPLWFFYWRGLWSLSR